MAAKTVKILTNSAAFPFLYEYAQRTVLEFQDAGPRMPGAFFGDVANAEFGQPQLIYCENVLPSPKGIFSVSFGTQAPAVSPAVTTFDHAIQIRDTQENQYLFSPADGANYLFDPVIGTWASVSPFTFTQNLVTRAYVNGRTFICYEKTKIIEYNYSTGLFDTLTLTLPPGITMSSIRGIGGASNYLLLFTDISVYWCTPLNILDFATSDQGAGQQTPVDIKGQITCLLPCTGGFIIYTARNAVGATFTNNGNAPFAFKEVTNCGGVPTWEQVTSNADEGAHYLWGTNGLQKANLTKAESIEPACTDFLAGNQTESWDAVAKQVVLSPNTTTLGVKLAFLAGRYLAISCGQVARNQYEFCLFFDVVLGRWGKVVTTHCDVFMYPYPTFATSYFYSQLPGLYTDLGDATYDELDLPRLTPLPAKRGIAFLKSSGQVDILNTDFAQAGSGVAIFGRLQSNRQRVVTVLGVSVDSIKDTGVTCTLLPSDDEGQVRTTPVPMTQVASSGATRVFHALHTAPNFDLVIEGGFVLNNLLLSVKNHGYR